MFSGSRRLFVIDITLNKSRHSLMSRDRWTSSEIRPRFSGTMNLSSTLFPFVFLHVTSRASCPLISGLVTTPHFPYRRMISADLIMKSATFAGQI